MPKNSSGNRQRRDRHHTAIPRKAAAKLSVPRLANAVPRERLFEALDELAEQPLTWVHGPPGSGKTTLVAGYVRRSPRQVLWYRADEGDIDLATVFHHLREAALLIAPRRAEELAPLGPEYLLDIATFSRNFLRILFDMLEANVVVVFDNVHAAAESVLETVLKIAAEELPHSARLIAISRLSPPPSISALQMKGMLGAVGGQTLGLTLDEAMAIAAYPDQQDRQSVAAVLASCDGWTAGFVLLIEHARRLRTDGAAVSTSTREAIFSYFSGELFAVAPPNAQHLLLCTALLPDFTIKQAAAFATRAEAQQTVDWLCRHNFFIESRASSPTIYRYHDLFREFLLQRGRLTFSEQQRCALVIRAGQCAEEFGQTESALSLYLESQGWIDAIRLIGSLAPQLLAQGRSETLERFIEGMPTAIVGEQPWMLYWQGLARLGRNPRGAREALSQAYTRFAEKNDQLSSLMACSHILQTFMLEWDDQRPSDVWLERFRALWQAPGVQWSEDLEAQLLPSLIGALLRHPGDKLLAEGAKRAHSLLSRLSEPAQIVPLTVFLANRCALTGEWRKGALLLARLEQSMSPNVPPYLQLHFCALRIDWHGMCGDLASESAGRAQIEHFIKLSEASGVHILDVFVLCQGVYFALIWRDLDLAESLLARARRALLSGRTLDHAHFNWLCAAAALERGDVVAASTYAKIAIEMAEAGGSHLGACQNRLLVAQIHQERGEPDAALRELDLALTYARSEDVGTFVQTATLLKANVLLNSNRQSEGLAHLREGMKLGRETGQGVLAPVVLSKITRFLYATALDHQIEVDYVRKLIGIYRIKPPSIESADWPWPIKIYTLGHFSVLIDGEPLESGSKTQHKPLDLLKALLLDRAGLGSATLMEYLWPDSDGDAARNALNLALHRLRRLLKRNDAILMQGSKLMLDRDQVWVDAWAMQTVLEQADVSANEHEAATLAKKFLHLYRGHFLADEDHEWAFKLRDRLHSQFTRGIGALTKGLEAQCQWEALIALLSKVIEFDPLNEEFHRSLIRSYKTQGRHAESVAAYRRCSELFVKLLGTQPAAATRALVRDLTAEP